MQPLLTRARTRPRVVRHLRRTFLTHTRIVVLAFAALVATAACGGADDDAGGPDQQVLRFNLGAEPPSLDPALAGDTTSSVIVRQLNDGLVALDEDSNAVPNLAESWDLADGGRRIVFHLRADGRWTNGDPLTAEDFEWSWKRVLAPETASGSAYQLFGIVGAPAYNACKPMRQACEPLRDRVGIRALDPRTLEVELTNPTPWFMQLVAYDAFFAVHRPTVERFGERWTEPANIVTSGPFRLTAWRHDESLTLTRWAQWRDAASVELVRAEARIIGDATTALQAFEAGELDACFEFTCIPPAEAASLREREEWVDGKALATRFFGFNTTTISDPEQRRAMALAIDRRAIVDNITSAAEAPATTFTPSAMPGYDAIAHGFLSEQGDLERAREHLAQAATVKKRINLFHPTRPGAADVAVAVQADWKKLGLDVEVRAMEWAQYLQFLGPPPNTELDVYLAIWSADYVDAMNFLEVWACGNNLSGFCDKEYDRVLDRARKTLDADARYALYGQAEAMLTGERGGMPFVPVSAPTFPSLSKTYVEGWESAYDFTQIRLAQ
jgi:oligopeptide transport system substrate-binding protein